MHVGSSTRHLSELLIWREIYCKETKMCGHFNDITLKLWHNTKTNMTFSEKSQTQVQSILDRCRLQWLKLFHPDQLWILSCFGPNFRVNFQIDILHMSLILDMSFCHLVSIKLKLLFCNQTVSRYHVDNDQWSKWSCLISILATGLEKKFSFWKNVRK